MAPLLNQLTCAALLAALAATGVRGETEPPPASPSDQPACQGDLQDLLQGTVELLKGQQELRRELAKVRRRLEALQPQLDECPDKWMAFNESCFIVGADNRTADGAAAACAELHPRGRLASLELEHRYDVQHLLLDISPFMRFWIGLRLDEAGWRWSDGTLLTEQGEWMPPAPGDTTEEECAVYDRSHAHPGWTFGWIDEDCNSLAGYVCMIGR
ncbi:C-type lectin lectoxin-Phi2 [Amphibalanus amphitrite]|uniref:C-type lectin lectoxin-Phi2 n=1 Tax=Amphibalanus amphitrite TaxID=1232801 RepID=A0A6A4VS62_AMPAM|nr:C-type lectin lectoxin-Phi2 [Amphibalanus amphitrite]